MISHIVNTYVLKRLGFIFGCMMLCSITSNVNAKDFYKVDEVSGNWKLVKSEQNKVFYEHQTNKARLNIALSPKANITARQFTNNLMVLFKGHDLRPIPKVKGWSFVYSSNLPCSILVSYFNDEYYEVVELCGKASTEEVGKLIESLHNTK